MKLAGKRGKPVRLNCLVSSKLFPLKATHKDTKGKTDILPKPETEKLNTRPDLDVQQSSKLT